MKDEEKTKEQLINESTAVGQQLNELKIQGTDDKCAEEKLRESEQQYRTTIDSMGNAIHVIDSELRFILVNKTFKQWVKNLGLEKNVIGSKVYEVFPFLPKKVLNEYKQVFETGRTLITEESTEIGGKEFITETRKIPIFEREKICRVVTVIRDISERKRQTRRCKKARSVYGGSYPP